MNNYHLINQSHNGRFDRGNDCVPLILPVRVAFSDSQVNSIKSIDIKTFFKEL